MPFSFPALIAMLWYITYVCCFMVLPELIVYCVWRFLHDLRRVAVALETNARPLASDTIPAPLPRPAPGRSQADSIVPSQLGIH